MVYAAIGISNVKPGNSYFDQFTALTIAGSTQEGHKNKILHTHVRL